VCVVPPLPSTEEKTVERVHPHSQGPSPSYVIYRNIGRWLSNRGGFLHQRKNWLLVYIYIILFHILAHSSSSSGSGSIYYLFFACLIRYVSPN